MLTLYYSPGACSRAPHIALEEAGAAYALQLVSIPKGEHQAPEYLNVNPRGNTGAGHRRRRADRERRDPDLHRAHLSAVRTAAGRAVRHGALRSHMAWLSNTVHPAFTHVVRPGRFVTDDSAQQNVKATGRENAWKLLQELDRLLDGHQWVLGPRYSVADPYTLVIYGWAKGTACRWSNQVLHRLQ